MTEVTYSFTRILELAGEPDKNGYREATIEVAEGETVWAPGTTKFALRGPCVIRYEIHPSGIDGSILSGEPSRAYFA